MKVRALTAIKLTLLCVLALPIAAVVYAAEDCCHGTTCENNPACYQTRGSFYDHTCKRTCSGSTPACVEGDGCCEFDKQDCMYANQPGQTCPLSTQTQIVNVFWYNNRYCRNGANQVPCLDTHTSSIGCNF
jgi:hypothetical protein